MNNQAPSQVKTVTPDESNVNSWVTVVGKKKYFPKASVILPAKPAESLKSNVLYDTKTVRACLKDIQSKKSFADVVKDANNNITIPPPKQKVVKSKLSDEEYAAFVASFTQPKSKWVTVKPLCTIHVQGNVNMPVKAMKVIMEQVDIELKYIKDISKVTKSIIEIVMEESYKDSFKAKVAQIQLVSWKILENFKALDMNNFKKPSKDELTEEMVVQKFVGRLTEKALRLQNNIESNPHLIRVLAYTQKQIKDLSFDVAVPQRKQRPVSVKPVIPMDTTPIEPPVDMAGGANSALLSQ